MSAALDGDAPALEELLQFVYLTPVGIVKFGADGSVELINPVASQLLMPLVPDADLSNFFDALRTLVPTLREQVDAFTGDAGTILDQQRFEMHVRSALVVLSLTVRRVNATVYMAVLEDVTTFVEQSRKLSADEQRFRAIFDNVREYAIFTIGLDGRIEEWNLSLQRFGGWTAGDVEGRNFALFFPSAEGDDASNPGPGALLGSAIRSGSVENEGWRLRRDGSLFWGNLVITALPDEYGSPSGFVVVASDLTERKRLEDNLKELATVDPLTGAFNRRHGLTFLHAEFERRARTSVPFAALMLDIDLFKSINDDHGHDVGDSVLCAMVGTCKSTLRVIDMFARWGGEEFLVVLPGTGAEGAVVAAERLRSAIAAIRVTIDSNRAVTFTASIGVAVPSDDGPEGLLRRADEALYAAKAGGRNTVVFAPPA